MKIMHCLCPQAITADLKADNKKDVLVELVEMLKKAGKIKDTAEVVDLLMQREGLGSTGIGQGVAIPHGRCEAIGEQVAALGISRKGVNFESLDNAPVNIFFLLLCPGKSGGQHLQVMARVSRLLKNKQLRTSLCSAENVREILDLIAREDE